MKMFTNERLLAALVETVQHCGTKTVYPGAVAWMLLGRGPTSEERESVSTLLFEMAEAGLIRKKLEKGGMAYRPKKGAL